MDLFTVFDFGTLQYFLFFFAALSVSFMSYILAIGVTAVFYFFLSFFLSFFLFFSCFSLTICMAVIFFRHGDYFVFFFPHFWWGEIENPKILQIFLLIPSFFLSFFCYKYGSVFSSFHSFGLSFFIINKERFFRLYFLFLSFFLSFFFLSFFLFVPLFSFWVYSETYRFTISLTYIHVVKW